MAGEYLDPSNWPMLPGDANPQTKLPEWLARLIAPNMTSLLSGEQDPNKTSSQPLPQYGKVAPTDDPRNDRAISEALMLGGSAMPAGRAALGFEGASRFIPEGMQSAPGMAARAMAPTLGLAALGPSEAGAADAGRPTITDDERASLSDLNKQIDAVKKRLDATARRYQRNPDALEKAQAPDMTSLNQLEGRVNNITGAVQSRQAEWDKAQLDAQRQQQQLNFRTQSEQEAQTRALAEEKRLRERPLSERMPGVPLGATIASPVGSSLLAYGAGRGARPFVGNFGQRAATIGTAAGLGGFEGGVVQHLLNEADANLPPGSPAQQQAMSNVTSPDWLAKAGLNVAASSGAAAIGAKYGLGTAGRRPIAVPSLGMPSPESPPASPPAPAPMPSSPPLMIQGKSGLWHYAAGSGKTGVVPKQLWPQTRTLGLED